MRAIKKEIIDFLTGKALMCGSPKGWIDGSVALLTKRALFCCTEFLLLVKFYFGLFFLLFNSLNNHG
jgi:hypothetical protein